jgi:hypothetical protein
MGCGSSSGVTIHFDRKDLFYLTDETVSGRVDMSSNKGDIKATAVHVFLDGELGYKTKKSVRNAQGNTHTQTSYHHVTIFSSKIVLASMQQGQTELILNTANNTWPFQFKLPSQLPPSCNLPGTYPNIRYLIKFVIERSGCKPNVAVLRYFTVFPRASSINVAPDLISEPVTKTNRKDVTLKATLNKANYLPGEIISVKLEIENPKLVVIEQLDISIYRNFRVSSDHQQCLLNRVTIPSIINSNEQRRVENCSISIPDGLLPPSYSYINQNVTHGVAIISYYVTFHLKVGGIFTDLDVSSSFVLGVHPKVIQNASDQQITSI